MRHLTRLVAAITVGLLAIGLLAVTSTSAQAAGRDWQTITSKARGKTQACRDVYNAEGSFELVFRQDGRKSKRRTKGVVSANIGGFPFGPITTGYVRPGRTSKVQSGGSFQAGTNYTYKFVTKVKGGGKSVQRVRLQQIRVC